MKKIIIFLMAGLLLNLGSVNAITQQEINEAKSLIDSKANCKSLSDSQLEIIGEYYVEQMHPGEAHDLMHQMIGLKEGSEAEKQFHINMVRTMYCDEGGMMGGQSGGMMGGQSGGMMGGQSGGMMGGQSGGMMGGQSGGMMGGWGYGFGYWNFINILYVVLLIGLIILVYLWIIKLWKNVKNKDGKNDV